MNETLGSVGNFSDVTHVAVNSRHQLTSEVLAYCGLLIITLATIIFASFEYLWQPALFGHDVNLTISDGSPKRKTPLPRIPELEWDRREKVRKDLMTHVYIILLHHFLALKVPVELFDEW